LPTDLKEIREALWQDVVFLHTKWNIFRELHATHESVALLNFAGQGFFAMNQMIWAENIQMAIARLTDPTRSARRDNLTLKRLLDHIDLANPPGLHDRVKAALDELDVLCSPIRERRKKLHAHSDLDTKLGRNSAPLDPVTKKVIDSSLEKIRDIMNDVERTYLESVTSFEFDVHSDAQELLYHLKEAREYQRQQRMRFGLPPDHEIPTDVPATPPQAQP
jgi:hypothetical protein